MSREYKAAKAGARTASVDCPHCYKEVGLEILGDGRVFAKLPDSASNGDMDGALFDAMRRTGLYTAFCDCYIRQRRSAPPSFKREIIAFFAHARVMKFNEELGPIIHRLTGVPPDAGLASSDMYGICKSGELRAFVAKADISKAKALAALPGGGQVAAEWIRTINGYVAGRGLLLDAIAGLRPGEFAMQGV